MITIITIGAWLFLLSSLGIFVWIVYEAWLFGFEYILKLFSIHGDFLQFLWYRKQFRQWQQRNE